MDDVKLSPELRLRIVEAVLNGPRERERQRELTMIDRVADLLIRVSDPEAERWLDEMSGSETNSANQVGESNQATAAFG